jgi:hypothetical protein
LGRVYVGFCGHDRDDPDTANIDLYVARSIDGGRTFAPDDTLRITDAMLNLPSGYAHQQIRINIAVDACGAVNVFYYQYWGSGTDQGGDWYLYFPRYLRIPNFPLTTGMFMSSLGPGSYLRANEFMGDYARMACTGNELYIPHPIKESDGTWNIYANHVHVCSAIADVNSDNLVNQSDLSLFTSWFTSADPRADLNQDGVVDAADFKHFSASYACACNP